MSDPQSSEGSHICNICGARMQKIHCKMICRRCGYTRDCSDP